MRLDHLLSKEFKIKVHTVLFIYVKTPWGCSSVGRAPALQAGGQEFESPHLHQAEKSAKNLENYIDIKKQTKKRKKQTIGQDNKGIRRMPWHQESKKDGTSTEMLRGAANRLRSGDIRMGEPT